MKLFLGLWLAFASAPALAAAPTASPDCKKWVEEVQAIPSVDVQPPDAKARARLLEKLESHPGPDKATQALWLKQAEEIAKGRPGDILAAFNTSDCGEIVFFTRAQSLLRGGTPPEKKRATAAILKFLRAEAASPNDLPHLSFQLELFTALVEGGLVAKPESVKKRFKPIADKMEALRDSAKVANEKMTNPDSTSVMVDELRRELKESEPIRKEWLTLIGTVHAK